MADLIPFNDATNNNNINSNEETRSILNNNGNNNDNNENNEIIQSEGVAMHDNDPYNINTANTNTTTTMEQDTACSTDKMITSSMIRLFLILLATIGAVSLVIILLTSNNNDNNTDKNITTLRPIVNDSMVTNTNNTNIDNINANTEDSRDRDSDTNTTKIEDNEDKENNTAIDNTNATETTNNPKQEEGDTLSKTTSNNNTLEEEPHTNTYLKHIIKSNINDNNCIIGNTMSMTSSSSSGTNHIIYGEKSLSNDNEENINIKLYDIYKDKTILITTLNNANYSSLNTDIMNSLAISSNGDVIAYSYYKDNKTYIRVLQKSNENEEVWNQVGNDINCEISPSPDNNEIILSIKSSISKTNNYYIVLGIGYSKDNTNGMHSGKSSIYMFDFINDGNNDWITIEELYGLESSDKLGTSISLSVDESTVIFATSAPNANSESIDNVGAFYIHRYNIIIMPSTNYTHPERRSKNTVYGSFYNGNFGSSVSFSSNNNNGGDRIAVGSKLYSSDDGNLINNGLCNVYEYIKTDWIQIGNSIIGEYNNSLLGSKVILSDDGNHVAITSKINIVSGDLYPTIVQMYEYSGENWGSNVKDDFRYDNKSDVGYGSNIVLSDDGNFLVISSDDDDSNQDDNKCGQIFLYDISSSSIDDGSIND